MVPYYIGGMVFGFLLAVLAEWLSKRIKYAERPIDNVNLVFASVTAIAIALLASLSVTMVAVAVAAVFWGFE